jgi:hypothetical protein
MRSAAAEMPSRSMGSWISDGLSVIKLAASSYPVIPREHIKTAARGFIPLLHSPTAAFLSKPFTDHSSKRIKTSRARHTSLTPPSTHVNTITVNTYYAKHTQNDSIYYYGTIITLKTRKGKRKYEKLHRAGFIGLFDFRLTTSNRRGILPAPLKFRRAITILSAGGAV